MTAKVYQLDRKMAHDATQWAMLKAFLAQDGVRVVRTLNTLSISFRGATAADEFERFLKQIKRT